MQACLVTGATVKRDENGHKLIYFNKKMPQLPKITDRPMKLTTRKITCWRGFMSVAKRSDIILARFTDGPLAAYKISND